jgi:hypothetical protein
LLAARAAEQGADGTVVSIRKPWEQTGLADVRQRLAWPAVPALQPAVVSIAPARVAPAPGAAKLHSRSKRNIALRTTTGFLAGLLAGAAVAWVAFNRQPEGVADTSTAQSGATITNGPVSGEIAGAGLTAASTPAPLDVTLSAAIGPAAEPAVRLPSPSPLSAAVAPSGQPVPASLPPTPVVAGSEPPILRPAIDIGQPPAAPASPEAPPSDLLAASLAEPAGADRPAFTPEASVALVLSDSAAQPSIRILLAGAGDRTLGAEAADRLRTAGYRAVETAETGIAVRETNVRYYHEADATAAQAIAEHLGTAARDFTSFRPRPPEGLVEIWLGSGRAEPSPAPPAAKKPPKANAAKPSPPSAKPAPQPAPSEAEQLQVLRDRVLLQLLEAKMP